MQEILQEPKYHRRVHKRPRIGQMTGLLERGAFTLFHKNQPASIHEAALLLISARLHIQCMSRKDYSSKEYVIIITGLKPLISSLRLCSSSQTGAIPQNANNNAKHAPALTPWYYRNNTISPLSFLFILKLLQSSFSSSTLVRPTPSALRSR